MVKSLEKPTSFFSSFDRYNAANIETTHYCPGCGHGIVHKLLAEAIDDLKIQDRTILVTPIGCAVFMYYYFEVSAVSVAHGRAPAAATAISRAHTEAITVSYQGDGDLSAIGLSHILHAANRGENMIVLFLNNNNYGMTGGQLAPTTLLGQKTTTSPFGRSALNDGLPIKMSELIAQLEAPIFSARCAVTSPEQILHTKRLLRHGLQAQCDKKGFVFLEILSPCPTNWHKTPVEACRWIEEEVVKTYPLGVWKDKIAEEEPKRRLLNHPDFHEIIKILDLKEPERFSEQSWPLGGRELRIKIAGFGGQGILLLGQAVANLGMRKGFEVTWLPSYGPEMRGGVANCSVVLNDRTIGSPMVEQPDVLIAMNQPSLTRFGPLVPKEGHIFYNRSMIEDFPTGIIAHCHPIDASQMAIEAGNIKAANSVMLAAMARTIGLFSLAEIESYLEGQFPKAEVLRTNRDAVHSGWNG